MPETKSRKPRRGTGRRKTRPYVWLYYALKQNLKRMETEEGSFYEALQGLVTSAFMVETYLNSVGDHLFADWDTKPLKGKSKAFQSILDKLKIVLVRLKQDALKKGTSFTESIDPGTDSKYQSLSEVVAFRMTLAHGREEVVAGKWSSSDGSIGMQGLETDWEKLLADREKVRRLCTDCVALVHVLNQMLREVGHNHIAPTGSPFISAASSVGWEDDDD